jgi:hypothetical protein
MEERPMSMINAYCVDEVTIVKWNGNDSWGEPASGTMTTIKGYVEWKTRLIRNTRGEEVVSSCMVYLPKQKLEDALGGPLFLEDRMIVDQGGSVSQYGQVPANSLDRAIVDIRQPKDFSSPHYEVYLA